MITAEEYIMENMQGADFQEIESALIGFATLKCQELLEIVYLNAEIDYAYDEWGQSINKDSILNAVDLDSFIV